MEYVWRPSSTSLGTDTQIFTHVLYAHYESPSGYEWDVKKDSDPWINNNKSKDFNAEVEAAGLIEILDERASHYLTDNLFVVFGTDFAYMNAFQNYINMDAMIEYMNEHHSDKYLLRYSTPSDYIDAVAKQTNVTWPTKYDDMFPYSDNADSYWTGYFTSRPNDKEYIRKLEHNYHSSSKL